MNSTFKTKDGETVIVNDGVLSNEEYQAIKLHCDRKNSLGSRLVILKEYIKQSYGRNWVDDSEHVDKLEEVLDYALKANDYDIEKAADYYRAIIRKLEQEESSLCQCGYREPFCLC
jgi:hypothetical protein